jgi:hypothetical protein
LLGQFWVSISAENPKVLEDRHLVDSPGGTSWSGDNRSAANSLDYRARTYADYSTRTLQLFPN